MLLIKKKHTSFIYCKILTNKKYWTSAVFYKIQPDDFEEFANQVKISVKEKVDLKKNDKDILELPNFLLLLIFGLFVEWSFSIQ